MLRAIDLVWLLGLLAAAAAQEAGWVSGQINTTMCYWEQLRAAVVRDTLYLDGGALAWLPGMADGSYGALTDDGNPLGIVYTLNFSVPFAVPANASALLGTLSKAANGGAANNIAPNYYDGAMLANDAEWFLYGGLLRDTDAFVPPRGDAVLAYQAAQYGDAKPAFRPGFVDEQLPTGMTRYVAYGGAASAPAENKAWYFGGLHAPGGGPIYDVSSNASATATDGSATLLALDMAVQQAETWTNRSLPAAVRARANPDLVWVPVGRQGLLVAVGGVVYPDFVTVAYRSEYETASRAESPAFLTTIDVYDVAGNAWYRQPTTGGSSLGQRTRGCAVVAAAADASSFNIYYYGGYDGLDAASPAAFSDDVWVLSLPSFTWTLVAAGTTAAAHARAGHKCVRPYPDQMLVVGGYPAKATSTAAAATAACADGGLLQLFNLSSAQWMTGYSPDRWSPYAVPDAVVSVIGGNASGGATATAPAVSGGWATAALRSVFATPYPTSKLTTYYPYPLATATSSSSAGPTTAPAGSGSSASAGGSHVPGFVPPLVGVLGGIVVLGAFAAVVALLYRRRRRRLHADLLRRGSNGSSGGSMGGRAGLTRAGTGTTATAAAAGAASEAGTYDTSRNFVFSWLRSQPSFLSNSTKHQTSPPPSMTPTTAKDPTAPSPLSPEMGDLRGSPLGAAGGYGFAPGCGPVEMDNTYISEMIADTAHPVELPGESVVGRKASASSDDSTAGSGTAELESPVYRPATGATATATSKTAALPRPDSPSLGAVVPAAAQQTGDSPPPLPSPPPPTPAAEPAHASAVSDVSEQDNQRQRHASEGGVSVSAVSAPSPLASPGLVSPDPVSPTTPQPPPVREAAAADEPVVSQVEV